MKKKCLNCGIEFDGKPKQICCSRKCSNEFRYPKIYVECDICGKQIERQAYRAKRTKHNYCSIECKNKGVSMYQSGKNNPNYKGANTIVTCSNCGKEFKILICNIKNSNKSIKKNFYCSKECKAEHQKELLKGKNNPHFKGGAIEIQCGYCGKKKLVERNRYSKSKYHYCSQKCKAEHQKIILLGENNGNFKHGLSEEYRLRHKLIEGYNTWRIEVYERDNYTCQCCKNNKGGNLNAHHLDSYNWCEEKRTDVNNGVTLCDNCHKEFHKQYGYGDNTKEQFEDFLKSSYINPVII